MFVNNYNFIKVGLTSREPFMKRFQYKEYYDYEIETLISYSLPAKKAIELERDCLSNFINCRFLLRKYIILPKSWTTCTVQYTGCNLKHKRDF